MVSRRLQEDICSSLFSSAQIMCFSFPYLCCRTATYASSWSSPCSSARAEPKMRSALETGPPRRARTSSVVPASSSPPSSPGQPPAEERQPWAPRADAGSQFWEQPCSSPELPRPSRSLLPQFPLFPPFAYELDTPKNPNDPPKAQWSNSWKLCSQEERGSGLRRIINSLPQWKPLFWSKVPNFIPTNKSPEIKHNFENNRQKQERPKSQRSKDFPTAGLRGSKPPWKLTAWSLSELTKKLP